MKRESFYFLENLVRLLEAHCSIRYALEIIANDHAADARAKTAAEISDRLANGESLSDALIETGALTGSSARAYKIQLDRTGDVTGTLSLALRDIRRERELSGMLVRAMLYPAFLVTITLAFAAFLAIAGIPWIRDSGFIRDERAIEGMYEGIWLAVVILVVLATASCASLCMVLKKMTERSRYWSLAYTLAASGSPTEPMPVAHDAYTRITLKSAEYTGDHESALEAIAAYHARRLESFRDTVMRLAEPALILVAGITVAIISVTVFLPLFNISGSFA